MSSLLGANVIEVVVTMRAGNFTVDGIEGTSEPFEAEGIIFLSDEAIDIPERVKDIVNEEVNNRLLDEICGNTHSPG